jgi:hypothetical protein
MHTPLLSPPYVLHAPPISTWYKTIQYIKI